MRDAFYGQVPQRLPRTMVMHGTLDPNTPYKGSKAHAAALTAAGGRLAFFTVEGGAHFLPLVAPDCFIQAASAFVEKRRHRRAANRANRWSVPLRLIQVLRRVS